MKRFSETHNTLARVKEPSPSPIDLSTRASGAHRADLWSGERTAKWSVTAQVQIAILDRTRPYGCGDALKVLRQHLEITIAKCQNYVTPTFSGPE